MKKIKKSPSINKKSWSEKIDKLLDFDGVIILRGAKSWANFLKVFYPGEIKNIEKGMGFLAQYRLGNMLVKFMENPVLKNQTVIIDER